MPIPVAVQSKDHGCSSWFDVTRQADHSSRGILPCMCVCVSVCLCLCLCMFYKPQ